MRIWSGILFGGLLTAVLLIVGVKPAHLPWTVHLVNEPSAARPTLGDLSAFMQVPVEGEAEAPASPTDSLTFLQHRLALVESQNRELMERVEQLSQLASLEERLAALETRTAATPLLAPHAYPFPETVVFCGEKLPLDRPDVFARFEEEFYRLLVNRHWLMTWMRRSLDIFPIVEEELRKAKVPDDLKYVMTIESGLKSRATSGAGAAGYWQFIRATGQRYGLTRNSTVDERRNLRQATQAAISYYKELHEEFNSWPSALASYNAGENRVRTAIKEQGTHDYYDMFLPQETESYWFRAAAVKVLLQNPEDYDLWLLDDGAEAVAYDTVRIKAHHAKLELKDLAAVAGISYRTLKSLNPEYRRPFVPKGEWTFVLPHSGVKKAMSKFPGSKVLARGKVIPRSTQWFLREEVALPLPPPQPGADARAQAGSSQEN